MEPGRLTSLNMAVEASGIAPGEFASLQHPLANENELRRIERF